MRIVSPTMKSIPRCPSVRPWSSTAAVCRRGWRSSRPGTGHSDQNLLKLLIGIKKAEGNSDILVSTIILLSRLPQISDVLSFVKEILQQLTNQRASIEEDIQSSFEDLHKQLDVRKSVLLMELEVTYGLKQKVHT